jgi:hypothetical protein
MNGTKLTMRLVLGLSLASVLASSAVGETESYFQVGHVYSSPPGPITFDFVITPFDASLGTLNSVTVYAEVNVSGSAQLWSADEFATLSVEWRNTLAAVSELGWGSTEAKYGAEEVPLWYYDYDFGEGYVQETGSGNKTAGPTTITSGFGRFAGAAPFTIGLVLTSDISATGFGNTLASSYDGNATLSYEYDYTPAAIPEPSTTTLVLLGLIVIAGIKRVVGR